MTRGRATGSSRKSWGVDPRTVGLPGPGRFEGCGDPVACAAMEMLCSDSPDEVYGSLQDEGVYVARVANWLWSLDDVGFQDVAEFPTIIDADLHAQGMSIENDSKIC